jgi:uncharacterized protein YjaG (DUF416 family)
MSNEELNSLDDYEQFVSSTVRPWSQQQRIALAVAMAERWLPAYESFSEESEFGDPAVFQRAVQAVWSCVLGDTLTSKERRLHNERVEENTPHLDDFDCEEAIATSAMIFYALNCCATTDNTEDVVMAMVSGFEGVAPGIYTAAEEMPEDIWELPEVQTELEKQLKLIKLIGDMDQFDKQQIEALRPRLVSPELVGSVAPRHFNSN